MRKTLKNIRYFFEYIPVFVVFKFFRIMPYRGIKALAKIFGCITFSVPSIRKLICANIKTAFPGWNDKKIKSTGKASICNIILTFMEFIWMMDKPKRIEALTFIRDIEMKILRKHEKNNESIIFVTPHFGNWEASAIMVGHYTSLPMAVIARLTRNPYFNRLINSRRALEGNEVIYAKGSVKAAIRAVRNGKCLGTLIDQNSRVRDGGIFVDFFGIPVPSSRAPALFGKMKNTAVYLAGAKRDGDKIVSFLSPLPKKITEYEDDRDIIQDLMNISEHYIRENPEQYLWFYKRFQYIPKDADAGLKAKYPYYANVASERFYSKVK